MTPPKINLDYLRDHLAALLATPSPTGFTDTVVRLCCDELTKLGIPFEIPRRGGIRARIEGGRRRPARALIAHVDTLGAQVKRLKENGRLELVPIGTWSARFAEGARVTVYSDHGSYRGTILPLKASGHTFGDDVDDQPTGWNHVELRVDALARNRPDLEALGLAVGDIVAIDPGTEFLDNGYINSRHLDDKAGVAVLLAVAEALTRNDGPSPPVDVYLLFTIAEEIGLGAAAILNDDIASIVAVDNGTTAPGQDSAEFGATICMADQSGPFDYHLTRKLISLCAKHDIPYQRDIFRYYRSDSASALEAGHDVRTALIAFGVDASHGWERIHIDALLALASLSCAYLLSPVEINRDAQDMGPIRGFTEQSVEEAEQTLTPNPDLAAE